MKTDDWQKIKELFNATIELPELERAAILENIDASLRREVENLIKAHESIGDFIAEPAMVEVGLKEENETDFYLGKQIDSYKILREIGAGGMGTVYLAARDDDFEKQVAVKLIKRGMDTNAVLKRFVVERQILANLEHPNIAGLLDGGSTTDGLPYLVMEYIEGEPITRFCDSHQFSTEERLKLFQEICAAVSYAHQNLVVHRDLKPSNILVTTEGVPKLLDFGIAKLLHPDWSLDTAEATATMFRLMTPEYASPEQLRGLPITTTSDVYSLGVVLYELLTGERPYKIEGRLPEEAAQIVLTVEPIKPSSVISSKFKVQNLKTVEQSTNTAGEQSPKSKVPNPNFQNLKSLRGDLDNIILKALRKEPERRYHSVQEFCEDIRRHLAGLPVTATADTSLYRAGKFFRRHRLGVFAGLLIALTLLSATIVTTWQAIAARRAQAKAEQRFNQVRKLANTVLFEYHDGIEKLPGSTPIREKMVKDALEYLDNLSSENIEDKDLQLELAAAYEKVGDVQGDPFGANLGNSKEALESYKKALAIRERFNPLTPESASFKLDLIRSYEAVAGISQASGETPAALENYRKAFVVFDSLQNQSAESKFELSVLERRFAKALAVNGKLAEALENYRKSIALLNELIISDPNDLSLRRNLATTNIFLGDALVESGDFNEALAAERAAYSLLEPLIITTDAQSRRSANTAHTRVSKVLAMMGDHQGALEIELKALVIDEDLARADPSNSLARRDVYVDHLKIAREQAAIGDFKSALANQRQFLTSCEAEIALNPDSSELRIDLAVGYQRYGEILEKSGDLPAALETYKKMLSLQEEISLADPANARQRGNLAEILTKVSDTSLELGDKKNVLEDYQKALTIREELVAAHPENDDGRAMLADIYKGLGDYFTAVAATGKRVEDWQEAKRRYQQSLSVWKDLQERGKYREAVKPAELWQKINTCEMAETKLR